MEEEKIKEQLNMFLQNKDNQRNALAHAQQINAITNGGWFTINLLRKKLHNAKRDDIKQIIHLLTAFGLCESQNEKDSGTTIYRIVFQNHHKLELLNIELGLHERRIEVIKKEIEVMKKNETHKDAVHQAK